MTATYIIKPFLWPRKFLQAMGRAHDGDIIILPRPYVLFSAVKAVQEGFTDKKLTLRAAKYQGQCVQCKSLVYGLYCTNNDCLHSSHQQSCAVGHGTRTKEAEFFPDSACTCKKDEDIDEYPIADI